jgi:hypothetical protein
MRKQRAKRKTTVRGKDKKNCEMCEERGGGVMGLGRVPSFGAHPGKLLLLFQWVATEPPLKGKKRHLLPGESSRLSISPNPLRKSRQSYHLSRTRQPGDLDPLDFFRQEAQGSGAITSLEPQPREENSGEGKDGYCQAHQQ